jgi:hypothetical protein
MISGNPRERLAAGLRENVSDLAASSPVPDEDADTFGSMQLSG